MSKTNSLRCPLCGKGRIADIPSGAEQSQYRLFKLYPRKWTRDFDPWPRSADTHLTHRFRSAAPVL